MPKLIEQREWWPRMARSMRAAWGAVAAGSPGATTVEREGLVGIVLPAVPERSIFNSVVFEEPEALDSALDELRVAYDTAGSAWTVWVPEGDTASPGLLEAAGHVLDSTPRAMGLDLERLVQPDPDGIEWTADGSLEALKRVNDAAYGYSAGTFERGLGDPPPGTWRIYEAREGGEPVTVLATTDVGGDSAVWWVATLPEARGRGLAGRLLALALAEARERGMKTSTLQASAMGAPVYERLGFEDVGGFEMWERGR